MALALTSTAQAGGRQARGNFRPITNPAIRNQANVRADDASGSIGGVSRSNGSAPSYENGFKGLFDKAPGQR